MTIVETTCAALREKLATYLDRVFNDREVILVKRRGRPNVAIIAADQLTELKETALLRRSQRTEPLLKSSRKRERGGVRSRKMRNSTTR